MSLMCSINPKTTGENKLFIKINILCIDNFKKNLLTVDNFTFFLLKRIILKIKINKEFP